MPITTSLGSHPEHMAWLRPTVRGRQRIPVGYTTIDRPHRFHKPLCQEEWFDDMHQGSYRADGAPWQGSEQGGGSQVIATDQWLDPSNGRAVGVALLIAGNSPDAFASLIRSDRGYRTDLAYYRMAARVRVQTPATEANDFTAEVGFLTGLRTRERPPQRGLFWLADRSRGPNWFAASADDARGLLVIETAVRVESKFVVLEVEVEENGERAWFRIDGEEVAIFADANVPKGPFGLGARILRRGAAPNPRNLGVDWVRYRQTGSSER